MKPLLLIVFDLDCRDNNKIAANQSSWVWVACVCVRDIDEDGDLENDGGYDVFLTGGNMLVSHDSDDVNEDGNGYDAWAAWEGKRH